MKRCSKCKRYLPQRDFYRDKKALDGHTSACQKCIKAQQKNSKINKELGVVATKAVINDGYKKCSKCEYILLATKEFFNKSKNRKDGLHPTCKKCRKKYRDGNKELISERGREYYKANKEKISERDRKYRDSNKEKISERGREYYKANKELISERGHEYYEANKEKKSEKDNEYRKKNRKKIRIREREYRKKNRKKILEYRSKWLRDNKDQVNTLRRQYYQRETPKLKAFAKKYRLNKRSKEKETLNTFYRTHEVPNYLWIENEFPKEKDFQVAIEWVIVNKLNLDIEHAVKLDKIGIPDIYITDIGLIIEVKLHSARWTKSYVKKQVLRYSEMHNTVIVSLDGAPDDWMEQIGLATIPWMNPQELFSFIVEITTK